VDLSIEPLRRIVLVRGLFSHCFDNKGVVLWDEAAKHLRAVHGSSVDVIPISGVAAPDANAANIEQYFEKNAGPAIAIGHSKGAVDLMTAVQKMPHARAQIESLVSVAGAAYGSRLVAGSNLAGTPLRLGRG